MSAEKPVELPNPLIEAAGGAVLVVDRSGTIEYANRRIEVLLGYSPNEGGTP